MPGKKPKQPVQQEEEELSTAALFDQISALFSLSQHSVATHRKNINTLHAIFVKASTVTQLSDDGESIRLTGEKKFGEAFRQAVVYPLGVKKGVEQADRVVKFIAGFVGFAVEFDAKEAAKKEAEGGADEDDEDGPASRLVSQLLAFLLKGFQAKNKVARFRCVQLVALMVNSLGEIDDDSYTHLKGALLDRVKDKESTVRMQAVVALSKLQTADDDQESDDDDTELESLRVADVLVDVLTHDSATEVRRAALFNLLPTPESIPSLLLRAQDIDPINRRATFTHVLFDVPCSALSKEQKMEVMGRGLRDRVDNVKKGARRLVAKWVEEVMESLRKNTEEGEEEPELGAREVLEKFCRLFEIFDGGEEVSEKVLEAAFEMKPDVVGALEFDDAFYNTLTPHSAFLARTYFNHLRKNDDPRLADIEPVVTALAFYTQAEWTKLDAMLDSEERDADKEFRTEFIVGQLVGMAVNVDYGDEIGRRKMFELMREMLSHPSLPASLIPKCLDVLLKGTSERDFMRIVVEIVQDLRVESTLMTSESEAEADDSDSVFGGADSESNAGGENGGVPSTAQRRRKKKRMNGAGGRHASKGPVHVEQRKELDLRCLVVVRALLERVMGALQENSMLHGLVAELIVPSVKTKDLEVRAEGLICLGLCCLLDRSMALDSFELLARQSQATEGMLQVKILQTIFDILTLHGVDFGAARNFGPDVVLGFLLSSLEAEEPEVVATAVVGIAKLMLAGMLTDEELLSRLALLYFASETIDNQELRQCLSYFFPVYCYSNPQNQRRVSNIFLPTLSLLRGVYETEEKTTAMVAPLQIGLQLVDWTNPEKAVQSERVKPDEAIHFDLAVNMVKMLYEEEEKDERKLLCQLLPKLYIPEEADDLKVKGLLVLLNSLKLNRPLADAVSRNALIRFEKALLKTFGERIEALGEEELKDAVALVEAKAFIRSILADGDEDEEAGEAEEEDAGVEEEVEEGEQGGEASDLEGELRGAKEGTPATQQEQDEDKDEDEEE